MAMRTAGIGFLLWPASGDRHTVFIGLPELASTAHLGRSCSTPVSLTTLTIDPREPSPDGARLRTNPTAYHIACLLHAQPVEALERCGQ